MKVEQWLVFKDGSALSPARFEPSLGSLDIVAATGPVSVSVTFNYYGEEGCLANLHAIDQVRKYADRRLEALPNQLPGVVVGSAMVKR